MHCLLIKKAELKYSSNIKRHNFFSSNYVYLSKCAVSMLFNKNYLNDNEQNIFNLKYLEWLLQGF